MTDKEIDKFIQKCLENNVRDIKDILQKKTFVCSIYFLNYLNSKDLDDWNKFIKIFETLSYEEMLQVFANVSVNQKAQQEKEKCKIKLKGND